MTLCGRPRSRRKSRVVGWYASTAWKLSDGEGVKPKQSLRCVSDVPRKQSARKYFSALKAWSHHQQPDFARSLATTSADTASATALLKESSASRTSSWHTLRKRPPDLLANASAIMLFPLPGTPHSNMARTPSRGSWRFFRARTRKALGVPESSWPMANSYRCLTRYSRTASKRPAPCGDADGSLCMALVEAAEAPDKAPVTSQTPPCWNIFRRSGSTSSSTGPTVCADWKCRSNSAAD
mmetsp:Transcript_7033/g.17453  ORF Transcript_7033/g.17453 Transcript_7033/m.17453 type:complete len:239 (+) Transcript_7033:1875-2591(+)